MVILFVWESQVLCVWDFLCGALADDQWPQSCFCVRPLQLASGLSFICEALAVGPWPQSFIYVRPLQFASGLNVSFVWCPCSWPMASKFHLCEALAVCQWPQSFICVRPALAVGPWHQSFICVRPLQLASDLKISFVWGPCSLPMASKFHLCEALGVGQWPQSFVVHIHFYSASSSQFMAISAWSCAAWYLTSISSWFQILNVWYIHHYVADIILISFLDMFVCVRRNYIRTWVLCGSVMYICT